MLVVDASVFISVVSDDGPVGMAARAAIAGHEVAAPHLVDIEVVSGLRQLSRSGHLVDEQLADAIDDYLALPIDRYGSTAMLRRVSELRHNLTPYDAAYVVLAEVLGVALVTHDGRLARAPGSQCRIVHLEG